MKTWGLIFVFFQRGARKLKDFEVNVSKHFLNLIITKFFHECSFDLLLSFPDI